jgi:tetratricopeptide (TPR) repeat protein
VSLAHALLLLCAWTAPVIGQAGVFQATVDKAAQERQVALELDPRTLPHAAPERWSTWKPSEAPPETLRAPLTRAGAALRSQDVPLALVALFAALEVEPDYPPALHQVGALFFKLQRYGDAVVAFERFLQIVPGMVGQTRGLAHGLYSLGRYDEALAHYGRVLAAAPDDVEALRGCALCHMRLGDSEQALELLGRCLELDARHVEAATWRARILYDVERVEEAHEAALAARELDEYRPQIWFLLGQILIELGQEDESGQARKRFEELDRVAQEVRTLEHRLLYAPGELGVHARLVELHRSVGDVGRTRSALAKFVSRKPRAVDVRVFALDVLEEMGDLEGARIAAEALEQACAREPDAWKRLERFYAMRGERMKQVECGERFLRLSGASTDEGH